MRLTKFNFNLAQEWIQDRKATFNMGQICRIL